LHVGPRIIARRYIYGAHQSISSNCRVRLYLDAADPDTQQKIARQIGTATEVREAKSRSWQPGAWFASNESESQAEHTRELMDGGAARLLPGDQMLALVTGCKPLKVSKLIDFDQREPFRSRLKKPALARPVRDPRPETPISILEI
jgi:type IV secretory pathway TraG/TraD family ATPase VirD4